MSNQPKILVIGKNSFLAQAYLQQNPKATALTYEQAMARPEFITYADYVINCAIDPNFYTDAYTTEIDTDHQILPHLGKNTTYIMLSSRKVYGPSGFPYTETQTPDPRCPYGKNKLKAEGTVRETLGDKACILRLSNIFGLEVDPPRKTFTGSISRDLVETDQIILQAAPETKKDFLQASEFARILDDVIRHDLSGTYNVGAGISVRLDAFVSAILKGYGSGKLIADNHTIQDQFEMDCGKLSKTLQQSLSKDDILTAAYETGQSLRAWQRKHTN